MNKWKLLGLAGLAGVAATGAIIARDERRRAQMTPEEVRARLRQRLADAERGSRPDSQPGEQARPGGSRTG